MSSKKDHKNRNFRLRALDYIIIPIVLSFVILGGFFNYIKGGYQSNFNIEKTNVDYIIQTPSVSQIESINNLEHINSITPYIFSAMEARVDNSTVKTDVFVVNSADDMSNTMFSEDLLVKKSSKTFDNEIFIDENYAKINNLKLEDTLTIKVINTNIEYTVKAIYKTDGRHDKGMTMVINVNDTKTVFDNRYGNDYKYSGAFLDSNNIMDTNAYLDNYVPEGNLLTREDFTSEELYNIYLDSLDDINHKLNIFYRDNFIDQIHKLYDSKIALFIVLECLSVIVLCASIAIYPSIKLYRYLKTELAKDMKNNFDFKQESLMFNKYFTILSFIVFGVSCLSVLLNILIFKNAIFSIFNLLAIILPTLTIGLIWTIESVALKKRFKMVESKNQKRNNKKNNAK